MSSPLHSCHWGQVHKDIQKDINLNAILNWLAELQTRNKYLWSVLTWVGISQRQKTKHWYHLLNLKPGLGFPKTKRYLTTLCICICTIGWALVLLVEPLWCGLYHCCLQTAVFAKTTENTSLFINGTITWLGDNQRYPGKHWHTPHSEICPSISRSSMLKHESLWTGIRFLMYLQEQTSKDILKILVWVWQYLST